MRSIDGARYCRRTCLTIWADVGCVRHGCWMKSAGAVAYMTFREVGWMCGRRFALFLWKKTNHVERRTKKDDGRFTEDVGEEEVAMDKLFSLQTDVARVVHSRPCLFPFLCSRSAVKRPMWPPVIPSLVLKVRPQDRVARRPGPVKRIAS